MAISQSEWSASTHPAVDMPVRKAGFAQALVILTVSLMPMLAIVALMPVVSSIVQNFRTTPNIMTLAPLMVAAPGLCVAIFSPFAGYLTDKLGRRKLLLIFSILYGVGGILPFFIEDFSALMAGRLMLGVGEAFVLTIGNTLYGDYYDEKERAKWLMWQSITGAACGTLVILLSSRLAMTGWNYPFLIYLVAFAIALGTYFFIYEPKAIGSVGPATATPTKQPFPMKVIVQLVVMTLIAATLYFVYTLHFSLALNEIGITDQDKIGNYSAIASVAVPVGGFLYRFIATKSAQFQFACLFTMIGIGLIGIGLSLNIETVVASAWIEQLGAGMAIPVLIGWGLNNVPAEFRGRGMGFWGTGFFLGQFLSPLLVSAVRGVSGSLLSAFIVLGVVCLLMAVFNWLAGRRRVTYSQP